MRIRLKASSNSNVEDIGVYRVSKPLMGSLRLFLAIPNGGREKSQISTQRSTTREEGQQLGNVRHGFIPKSSDLPQDLSLSLSVKRPRSLSLPISPSPLSPEPSPASLCLGAAQTARRPARRPLPVPVNQGLSAGDHPRRAEQVLWTCVT